MEEYSKFALTFSGIVALQLPTMISCAPKGTTLATFQIGFPFNMSKTFLKHHFAFSPANITAGRYYTLVTSLFNHTDSSHLLANLMILGTSGRTVHTTVGRWHFLSAFLGGGITGNFAMWLHYTIQRTHLQKSIINPNTWPLLAGSAIGNTLDQGKQTALSSTFTYINSGISCVGCSASVTAILSLEACITLETIITRLRQAVHRNRHRRPGDPINEDLNLLYDLAQLMVACSVLWSDIGALFSSGGGLFDNFFAYTPDRIGHGGHLGGFLFGILYYYFCRRY